MKKWMLWYVGIAVLFVVCGIVGAAVLNTAPDAGLADVKSVEDLADLQVRIGWAQGDMQYGVQIDEDTFVDIDPTSIEIENYTKNKQEYIKLYTALDEPDAPDLVLLATATGNLEITDYTTGQEIVVDKIFKGEELLSVGDTCKVWSSYCLQVMDGVITYRSVLNLMQPQTQYLVFLEDNPLNDYTSDKNYEFISLMSDFKYIAVPYTPDKALPSADRCADYATWAQYTAFVAKDEIADVRNELRQIILQAYGLYEGEGASE